MSKAKPANHRASDDDKYLSTDDGKLIELDTPAFLAWLEANASFRFNAGCGGENSYRARKETLSGVDYWYAVKKVNNKLHKRFIGRSSEVTHNRLIEVANIIRQPSTRQKQAIEEKSIPTPQPETAAHPNLEERVTTLEALLSQLQPQLEALTSKKALAQ